MATNIAISESEINLWRNNVIHAAHRKVFLCGRQGRAELFASFLAYKLTLLYESCIPCCAQSTEIGILYVYLVYKYCS